LCAYTPGLKIIEHTIITKERLLPVPGEVRVKVGELVSYDTIVAHTFITSDVFSVPLSLILGIDPADLSKTMLKKEGDPVEKGELIAISKVFFNLFKTEYRAEESGTIELISDASGQLFIRKPSTPVNLTAFISGRVDKVIPEQGVIVKTCGAFIQGIFGIGGEKHGELKTIVGRDEIITPEDIDIGLKGKIIVGGSLITYEALKKAMECGINGIIVGGVQKKDIDRIVGQELGVAITGDEKIETTCIATEGFSKMKMAEHTYDLLESLNGKMASINGATQIRAGVMRPEIIVPEINQETSEIDLSVTVDEEKFSGIMNIGSRVRIIRRPYFGSIGNVVKMPIKLEIIETGCNVRVVEIQLDDNRTVTIPWANVELLDDRLSA
jgi:hypothetical protein